MVVCVTQAACQWLHASYEKTQALIAIPRIRIIALTSLAMLGFASNSLFFPAALEHAAIDPASFTIIRLVSGAVTLWLLVRVKRRVNSDTENGLSALALFVYATGFLFAYVSLASATGVLLLFGAVQAAMIGHGIGCGIRYLVHGPAQPEGSPGRVNAAERTRDYGVGRYYFTQ